MDDYAIASLTRANAAIASGAFAAEIVPVTVTTRAGDVIVDTDEAPGKGRPEKIPTLRAAFAKDGTITAATSSSISDGAAAVVLTRTSVAEAKGLTPVATLVGMSGHAQEPQDFTTAPIGAINKLLAQVGWSVADVDLWEVNEAFAAVTMAAMHEFSLPHEIVNVHGGACALGHPIGASGARIALHLALELKRRGGGVGAAALCGGGGQGDALIIRVPSA